MNAWSFYPQPKASLALHRGEVETRFMNLSSGDIAVGPAVPSDATSIADIQVRSFRATYPGIVPQGSVDEFDADAQSEIWIARIAEASEQDRRIVVASLGDRVAAYIYFGPASDPDTPPERFAQVFSIHTDPSEQGSGLGSELMACAEEVMRTAGFTHATLWVVAQNTGARRFYECRGWTRDGSKRRETLDPAGEPGADAEVETLRYRLPLTP